MTWRPGVPPCGEATTLHFVSLGDYRYKEPSRWEQFRAFFEQPIHSRFHWPITIAVGEGLE